MTIVNKTQALERVRAATNRFVESCRSAADADWTFRPTPADWSIADVAEHLTLADELILRQLSRLSANPLGEAKPSLIDEEIPYLFYRGGDEPPNIAAPTGAFAADRQSLQKLARSAASIFEWAEASSFDLRAFGLTHFVFGMLDGIQWLLFAEAHTERHRAQVIGLLRRRHSS